MSLPDEDATAYLEHIDQLISFLLKVRPSRC